MVTLAEFKKLEFKVATIKEVREHPDAERLYVLIIDVGGLTKQIVAGIKSCYSQEDLLGRQIVVIDNLEPALVRGIQSEGMLLAAQDGKGISVIAPDRIVEPGSIIK